MPEQDLKSTATKFLSSLVKFLHILCSDHVEFTESIELVGHIHLRVGHKYKFDYILNEKMFKEDGNVGDVFLSNSYHSCPPSGNAHNKSYLDQDAVFSELHLKAQDIQRYTKTNLDCVSHSHSLHTEDTLESRQQTNINYSVTDESSDKQSNQNGVTLEGRYNSTDCMFLPASLDDFEPVLGGNRDFHTASSSASFEETVSSHSAYMRNFQHSNEQRTLEEPNSVRSSSKGMQLRSSTVQLNSSSKLMEGKHSKTEKSSKNELMKLSLSSDPVSDMKYLFSVLAALCDLISVQEDLAAPNNAIIPTDECTQSVKKLFLQNFDREKFKKGNKILNIKKDKQKKQLLRTHLAEPDLSNEQRLLLAQDSSHQRKRANWKSIPEGPRKQAILKEHKKILRLKTKERQQKLLEMTEMLKRSQANDPGITIMSRTGGKMCVLHKSSVFVLSYKTQQLSLENIDEISEALCGKMNRRFGQSCIQNKPKDQLKMEYSRKICVKKKIKQIIGTILGELSDAGYRVIVTSTIGSEAGSHSAELSIVPIKMDDFAPEIKLSDSKSHLSEEELTKLQEKQAIVNKQRFSQEKIREIELKLLRVLTGTEEILIPTRKRYQKGELRPSDAERMKEYRKKLKQDPEKYQMYRQKRAMNKKKRRLGELAVKVTSSGPTLTSVPKESCLSQALISLPHPVSGVVLQQCPHVYEHPGSHQPMSSVVSVHSSQYVGQMSAMQNSHQHQDPVTFDNEMDIVELIAATDHAHKQHFG